MPFSLQYKPLILSEESVSKSQILPRNIYKITSGEFTGQWYINYGFPRFLSTVTPDCPAGITFAQWTNPYGAPGAPPTSITQYPAPAPDPYAPWGGLANWLRLRFLEYV